MKETSGSENAAVWNKTFCLTSFSLQSFMCFLHSFLCRASALSLHVQWCCWLGNNMELHTALLQTDHLRYILQQAHPRSRVLYLCDSGQSRLPLLNLCSHHWHLCDPWEGWSSPLIMSPLFPRSGDNPSLAKGFIWTWELLSHRQVVTACTSPAGDLHSGCLFPPLHTSLAGQKDGGPPKPLKHFVPICKKATRRLVRKSLPDGKTLHQEL